MPHNLVATGTPVFVAGKFGNAFSVTGTANRFNTSDNLGSAVGTVELWMKKNGTSSGTQVLVGSNTSSIWIGLDASGRVGVGFYTTSVVVTDNLWHHIAYTVDGSGTLRVWVDGAAAGSTSGVNTLVMANFAIGSYGTDTGYPYTGLIDEVRISNVVRYTAPFTPPTAAFTPDSNTTALYHLESDGTDATGAGSDTTAPVISSFTATPGNAQVALAWAATDNTAVTRYVVTRGGTTIYDGTATSFTDTGLTNGTSYSYVLTAYDAAGNTSTANASATPTAAPTAPGSPTALAATAGNGQVALTWTAPASNGGSAVTDYLVEYQPSGGSWTTFADGTSTATSATVTGLTNGTAYAFRVSAVNAVGTSSPSTTASATPAAPSSGVIAPNDGNLVYSPYTWQIGASQAVTVQTGAFLRAAVSGGPTAITATFDTSTFSGSCELAITVDNDPTTVVALASSVTIPLPTSNPWTKHVITIVVRRLLGTNKWSTPTTAVRFTGFTVAPTTVVSMLRRRRPYSILCLADSLGEGYNAVTGGGAVDGRFGWAFPLGDLIGAEVGVVAFSGQGLAKTGDGGVPALPSSYNLLFAGAGRPFTTPTEPDVVVINMGTNDSGDITSPATTVLNGLLAATTNTKILVVQQWNGTAHKAQWQAAITACTTPSRVTYLDTTGWLSNADTPDNIHPYGYINITDLSPRIAAAIKPLLVGSAAFTPKRFVRRNGAWVPIG